MGVKILLGVNVTSVREEDNVLTDIEVWQSSGHTFMPCHSLVLSAGPWSDRLLKQLFPSTRIHIPFDIDSTSGNHLVLKIPGYEGERPHCDLIFLEGVIGQIFDISDYVEGSLYVGGYIARAEELPETVMEVKPQKDCIRKMKVIAMDFLASSDASDIDVLEVGRAYRPFLTIKRPIIAKAALHELFDKPEEKPAKGRAQIGGVFFNVGHGSDGITLSLGSGKVMSELIRNGRSTTDISGLTIPAGEAHSYVDSLSYLSKDSQ